MPEPKIKFFTGYLDDLQKLELEVNDFIKKDAVQVIEITNNVTEVIKANTLIFSVKVFYISN